VFVAAAFGLYLARTGDAAAREFIPVLAALAGALGGFLWFNAHPASLFMGDTGSLYIGGLLAVVAIVARAELFLAVAGLLFAAEALSVIIQVAFFRTTGRRVFLMSPIHHHFEKAGWPETRVVARFWIFTAACCAAALMAFAR
jgi:phospho-N-acetylmuramoyl-pentapeptide-transferase